MIAVTAAPHVTRDATRLATRLTVFAALTVLAAPLSARPATTLHAQPTSQPVPISGTVGDLQRAVQSAARVARLADTLPGPNAVLLRHLATLDRAALDTIPLAAVGREWMVATAANRAPFARVARWRTRDPMSLLSAGEQIAIDSVALVSLQLLPELLELRMPEDSVDALLAPISAFDRARRQESLAQSLEKLRRYERKFGPTSARLNVAEVALNFVAQSIPPFRPSADGWPSPLEVVASYVPSYLTVSDGKATAWTVLEVGARYYVFDPRWGRGGLGGVLRPAHLSAGIAIVNGLGGALREPWRGASRVGGFLAWGDAKLAIVGGDGPNIFLTRQIQLVPWVF